MKKDRFMEYQDRFIKLRGNINLIADYLRKTENSCIFGCIEKIINYFAFSSSCCYKVLLSMFSQYCHKEQKRPEIRGLGLLFDESMWCFKKKYK